MMYSFGRSFVIVVATPYTVVAGNPARIIRKLERPDG